MTFDHFVRYTVIQSWTILRQNWTRSARQLPLGVRAHPVERPAGLTRQETRHHERLPDTGVGCRLFEFAPPTSVGVSFRFVRVLREGIHLG